MPPLYGQGALAALRSGNLPAHRVLACVAGYTIAGSAYVYGGESGAEGGYDCSGTCLHCAYIAGCWLNPHENPKARLTSQGIFDTWKPVTINKLQPGDVSLYGASTKAISHVALVLECNAFGSPLAILSASNGNSQATNPVKSLAEGRYLRIFRKPQDAHLYRSGFVAFRQLPDPS